jgi:hypothetical protein
MVFVAQLLIIFIFSSLICTVRYFYFFEAACVWTQDPHFEKKPGSELIQDSADSKTLEFCTQLCSPVVGGGGGGGVTLVKWFLHSLESCDMLQRTHDGQVTVHLSFNTVRRDR